MTNNLMNLINLWDFDVDDFNFEFTLSVKNVAKNKPRPHYEQLLSLIEENFTIRFLELQPKFIFFVENEKFASFHFRKLNSIEYDISSRKLPLINKKNIDIKVKVEIPFLAIEKSIKNMGILEEAYSYVFIQSNNRLIAAFTEQEGKYFTFENVSTDPSFEEMAVFCENYRGTSFYKEKQSFPVLQECIRQHLTPILVHWTTP